MSVVEVAPEMSAKPLPVSACHRTVTGAVPLADAVNVAVPPLHATTFWGCCVMARTELTDAIVWPAAEVQPFTVIVTLYVPEAAVVALTMLGFCEPDAKPFGPVQL